MKNIGVKVLIGLCTIFFIVVLIEVFIIENKNKELKNSLTIISSDIERIEALKQKEKELILYTKMLNSEIEEYQKPEEKASQTIHPIEKEVQNCMKKMNYTTAGMINCVYKSEEKWEKEVQKYLSELKKNLTEEEYTLLLASQKDWEEYRKSQIKMIKKIYSNAKGTIYQNYASADIVAIVENRAKYLSWLLDISKDRK